MLPTLFGFNLGVELGQLLVVAALVPALALALRGRASAPAFVRVASLVLGTVGCGVLVARVLAPS